MSETSPSPSPSLSPAPEFPPVEPSNFDLIIIGTDLPSSIIAAASSTSGKTVLHLDPNPFYGSHFSSLSPPELSSFLLSPPPQPQPPQLSLSSSEFDLISLSSHSLYSDLQITTSAQNDVVELRKFLLDVAGPRVFFCADSAIDLILRSGINQYLEFKSVDSSLIFDGNSRSLVNVPDSRAAIFKDRSLSLTEKNQMMRFFKLVQQHLEEREKGEEEEVENEGVISKDDLEKPFIEFLAQMRLPSKIKSIILYAIAMADYDQEDVEICKDLLKTKDGINRLALYHSSIGRFPNAQGAMLYPMYGQGELPQAFCRRAAVKGCLYVLRMPIAALLAEKDTGLYKGVRLASGQDLFSAKLVIDSQFAVSQALASSTADVSPGSCQEQSQRAIKGHVARGICITRTSLKSDASNLLIVFPPKSLYPEQATSVRALQLSGNVAVCPAGMFVLYLSALCDDASQGKKLLTAAADALFRQPISGSCETSSSENCEDTVTAESAETEEQKPTLLWSALYTQKITEGSVETISTSPSPDGNLSYNDLINFTEKMFHEIYPSDEFFPEVTSTEDPEDADGDSFDQE